MNDNPYLSPSQWPSEPGEAGTPEEQVAQWPPQRPRRPRVWPIPLVLIASFLIYVSTSIIALLIAAWVMQGSIDASLFRDGARLTLVTQSPLRLSITLVLPQLALTVPALIAALASPTPLAKRLDLKRGTWPLWLWGTAAMATPLIGMISSIIVSAALGESKSLDEMSGVFRAIGEEGFLLPLAFLVGATPGICEELLFRGYMQTRVVAAWGAPLGIIVTSAVFAVFHMDLVHSVAVMALGVYLGWIAWASGSILTAMLAHFLNNFLSVLAVVLLPKSVVDTPGVPSTEDVPLGAIAILGAVMLVSAACLVVTLVQGIRLRKQHEVTEETGADLSDSPHRILPS